MKIVDLNILLYAVNRDADHHETVHAWWQHALRGEEPIALAWVGDCLSNRRPTTCGRRLRRHPDFQRIKKLLKQPVIFDGRNQYDPRELREMGFTYICIGRPSASSASPSASSASSSASLRGSAGSP